MVLNIYAGGYGIQGVVAAAFIRTVREKGIAGEVVSNGIGGFYAVVEELFGNDEALNRTLELMKRINRELYMTERRWICEDRRPKGWKKIAIEHCVRLATEESFKSWGDIEDLLDGLDKDVSVGAEYVDINGKIGVEWGNGLDVAKTSLAMMEIFPPFKGRFSTTHLTQIPVYTATDGDMILVNFRDPSKCDFEKADEILSQSAEVRSIAFARKILAGKKLKKIYVDPISSRDVADFESIKESFAEKLEGLV